MTRYSALLGFLLFGDAVAAQQRSTALSTAAPQVTVTYLGTAGWQISDGRTVILLDPYLSRLRRADSEAEAQVFRTRGDDSRPVFGPDAALVSDTAVIDAHIRRADYILVHHSHADHLMDVPYIARKTGATVIGTESTINAVRAYGIQARQLITVQGGEDYEFGTFSVRVIPSLHSPLDGKNYFDSRVISRAVKAPLSNTDYVEGRSLAYLIRLGGHEILTFGGMNYIEREIQGLRPDVVVLGAAPSHSENHDYAGRIMRALGNPALVLPTHWDNHSLALADERATRERLTRVATFADEIRGASPRTRVIVPRYFEPIVLPARR